MIVKEKIGPRFKEGICCCQQVFEELAPTLGLDEKTALRIAAGFGSGIGHGLTCGAVTAGLMALGLKYGNHIPGDDEGKARMN